MTAKYLRFLCTKRMKYCTVQQAEIHCFCSCCCQQKINFKQRTKRNEPETIEQNERKTSFSSPSSLETNGKFIRGKFRGKRNVMTTSLFIFFSTRKKILLVQLCCNAKQPDFPSFLSFHMTN